MELQRDQKRILELFKQGPSILEYALSGLSNNKLDYVPLNGGWSIRQIVHHIVDGDDLWKTSIKIALGNQQGEFTLKWYWAQSQMDWANLWNYGKRPIETSLVLLKANREHVLQLLEYTNDGWDNTFYFLKHNGERELISVGKAIQIQADHVVHHVDRIKAIRKEISKNNLKDT